MSQSLCVFVNPTLDISYLNNHLREQIMMNSPPYCLESLLTPFAREKGRNIRVVLNGLNVYIVESDIRHQVLQTTVSAFQRHRLSAGEAVSLRLPTLYETNYEEPTTPQCTGKTCSICLETIYSNNLQCLPCAHIFHRECVGRWLRQTPECPECRFKLT
jgi:hypothetical protein